MKAARLLRVVQAPGTGLSHLSDVRRPDRTLCGHGVLVRDGWQVLSSKPEQPACSVCRRVGERLYFVR